MKKLSPLEKLAALETQAKRIRKHLKISKSGEILYRSPETTWSDNDIVVEADGSGGARLLVVEGNYPLDYFVHRQQSFRSEQEACDAADAILDR